MTLHRFLILVLAEEKDVYVGMWVVSSNKEKRINRSFTSSLWCSESAGKSENIPAVQPPADICHYVMWRKRTGHYLSPQGEGAALLAEAPPTSANTKLAPPGHQVCVNGLNAASLNQSVSSARLQAKLVPEQMPRPRIRASVFSHPGEEQNKEALQDVEDEAQ